MALALIASVAGALATSAPPARATVSLQHVADFSNPLFVTAPTGDASRLFVVEQGGRVMLVKNGVKQATAFLDLGPGGLNTSPPTPDPGSEAETGLYSLAFDPLYDTNGRFWVMHVSRDGGTTLIEEYRRSSGDPDVADATSGRIVLSEPTGFGGHHFGGQLQMGPDGMLWASLGDNGQQADAGDGSHLAGKIIRIDPAGGVPYAIPADNPFATSGIKRPEIWASGLRNPWRFSFDRFTRDLVIADVGSAVTGEVDVAPAASGWLPGADYGWASGLEGTTPSGLANYVPALFARATGIERSLTGGYVVRDGGLPELLGRYLFGDLGTGSIHAVDLGSSSSVAAADTTDGTLADSTLTNIPSVPLLASFGEDGCGRVYVASLSGAVSRLVSDDPTGSNSCVPPVTGGGGGDPSVPVVNLSLDKSIAAGGRRIGDELSYSLTVRNVDTDTSGHDITVSDTLPTQVSFVRASPNCVYAESRRTVTCTIAALAPGASTTAIITASASTAGSFTNTASVTSSTTADPDFDNNIDDDGGVTINDPTPPTPTPGPPATPTTPVVPLDHGSTGSGDPVTNRPPPSLPPNVVSADRIAPIIRRAVVTPRQVRAGRATPKLDPHAGGSRIEITLSEAAVATMTFQRQSGRTWKSVPGKVVVRAAMGVNRVRFAGRLSRTRTLARGAYRVTITATDGAGNRSAPRVASFAIKH